MELILHDVICSLSSSLDLVGVTDVHHGKRVALIAATIAAHLGWDKKHELDMLYAGMLHDCGISTDEAHSPLTCEIEWQNFQIHCERGHRYLQNCPSFSKYAQWILHHHTRWSDLKGFNLSKTDKLAANLLFLADQIDFLQTKYLGTVLGSDILMGKKQIVDEILALQKTFFAPQLVDVFIEISKKESFWLSMDTYYINASVQVYATLSKRKQADFETLHSIAELFSNIIDEKSPFTRQHSKHVALLARFLAKELGFSKKEQQHIELAGMLHDLGKLRVPNEILDKNGKLDEEERACMLHHSFDTMQILKTAFPNTKIPQWAGYHHENLRGNGYPFRLTADKLDLGARIIAVADIFQALVQKRPYRQSMPLTEIKVVMSDMVLEGKLDEDVVFILEKNYNDCYELAQSARDIP
jgi:HD-GYP domain-containing protein (c-di-GMP phosphodiesterase class II)